MAQNTLSVRLNDAPALAHGALERGQPALALRIAEAILAQRPDDVVALLFKARAKLALNDGAAAIALADRAEALIDRSAPDATDALYVVARVKALARAQDGKSRAASRQLRRALQYAPNAGDAKSVRAMQAQLKAERRLSARAQLSFTPSSNVNSATSSEIFEYNGVPYILRAESRALSGITGSLSVAGQYRLARTDTTRSHLTFRSSAVGHRLSAAARQQAPDASGSDYAQGILEVGLRHEIAVGQTSRANMALRIGRNWVGGAVLSDTREMSLGLDRIAQNAALFGTDLSFKDTVSAGGASTRQHRLSQSVTWKIGEDGNQLGLSVHLHGATSDIASSAYSGLGASVRFALAKPVVGAHVNLHGAFETREYDVSQFAAGTRQDYTRSLGATATFQSLETFGFSPQVSISGSKTQSNVAIYDRETTSMGLGLVSTF